MYKDVLNSIDGAAIFPMISLTIFFIFFVAMIYYVMTRDSKIVNEMAALPFAEMDKKKEGDSDE